MCELVNRIGAREMTQKHTTTPWILDECCYGDNIIKGPNDEIIMWDTEYYPVAPSVEDMNHIVKCVNMHDELVEVLSGLMKVYSEPDETICCNGYHCGCQGASVRQLAEHYAEKALKKAGAL